RRYRYRARDSAALGAPPPFPADLPQVREEVDLDGVPGGAGVPPGGPRAIPGDLGVHLRLGRQGRAALEQSCPPLRLDLGYRHDRADRLNEADEVQPGQLRRDDAVVQGNLAVVGADQGFVEE